MSLQSLKPIHSAPSSTRQATPKPFSNPKTVINAKKDIHFLEAHAGRKAKIAAGSDG
jgi:hypothetical protein